jgi:choline transport protein
MDATRSKTATTIFLLIPTVLLFYGCRGCQMTAARLLLSLGRDKGLPYSAQFVKLRFGEPLWGLILSSVVASLAGLVQLGSGAAFSALLGTAVILLQTSYSKYEAEIG